ncbi:MAG: hypothetical protein C0402_14635 [Thermodesulfovibrio sp.]|nr:hypothetical protein [Thermodesulfovibrio sp.]
MMRKLLICSGWVVGIFFMVSVSFAQPFVDNGQTMTDQATGLEWPKEGGTTTEGECAGGEMNWDSAFNYVSCLNRNNYLGHNDWRLPNYTELQSVIAGGLADYSAWLNGLGFSGLLSGGYWSSTTRSGAPQFAWYLNMPDGSMIPGSKVSASYVWPVRGGVPGSFGKLTVQVKGAGTVTGNLAGISCGTDCTESYSGHVVTLTATPDPGAVFYGWSGDADCADGQVTMTSDKNCTATFTRFIVNADQTVTDHYTGLIWPQDGGTPTVDVCIGGSMNWDNAFNYVSCLNANSYLGHSDWRLPHKDELLSLVTNGGTVPFSDWLNTQGFTGVLSNYYWSSTTNTSNPDLASALYANHGTFYGFNKSNPSLYVWPVRSGVPGTFGTLNISKTGSGTVTSSPPGISCGADCTDNYSGIEVTLTAIADAGYGFVGWSGDADCTDGVVTMTADKNCTAVFTRFTDNGDQSMTDHITGLIWPKDGGTPTVGICTGGAKTWNNAFNYVSCLNQNNYLGNNDWRQPNKDELLSLVTNGGTVPFSDWLNSVGFNNVSSNLYWTSTSVSVTGAWLVEIQSGMTGTTGKQWDSRVWPVRGGQAGTYGSLTISKTGGTGTVTSSPPGISCGTDCTENYSGIEVTLTATPDAGFGLAGWSGDADCSDGIVSMTSDKNCTAIFSRFTDNGDQSMTDHITGLIWPKVGDGPTVGSCTGGWQNWDNAFSYVSCLNTNSYLGHSDWRLPNKDDLLSLVTHGGTAPFHTWLNSLGFIRVIATDYWSSTTRADLPTAASTISFNDGLVRSYYKFNTKMIWPVRGGQSGTFGTLTISKDGNGTVTSSPPGISCGADCTDNYSGVEVTLTATPDTGLGFAGWSGDADCSDGVVTMTSDINCTAIFTRFTDNGDQTMTDHITNLIWPKNGGTPTVGSCVGGTKNWSDGFWGSAFNYVSCLNTDNYLGHTDWRLPNKDELMSLVSHGGTPLYSDWLNSLGFSNVQANSYWSATTVPGDSSAAWIVNIASAPLPNPRTKTLASFAWPVRGGGGSTGTFGTLSISKTGGGNGTVTSSPPGIACGSDCAENYSGIEVTLTATPDVGFVFAGWSGDADCPDGVVTMTADRNCTATFSRFTPNADQTMTDNITGLIWPKNGSSPTVGACTGEGMSWYNAFQYIACLNMNSYLGHRDWRFPNKDEMLSLVTNGGTAPFNEWLNGLGFSSVYPVYYWSVTVYPYTTNSAWMLAMTNGFVSSNDMGSPYYVWPVRGGQVGTFGSLTVLISGGGSGTVTSFPPGISCGLDCAEIYSGIDIALSATAVTGSFFQGWTIPGGGAGNVSPSTVTMTSDKTIDFHFKICSEWPVMADKRYESISTWSVANSSFFSPVTLQFMGGASLSWDPSIDQQDKVITLSGGYDCSFGGGRTAGESIINGPVEIGHAAFEFDEITIR